jgi:hypothetical protein
MIMTFSTALVAALSLSSMVGAFMGPSSARIVRGRQQKHTSSLAPSTTRIFLEDWVAEMIDSEIWRQGHRKEFESAWMEKNRAAIVQNLNPGGESTMNMAADDPKEFAQHARDVRMAQDDPQRYCADRCISTGNCDVYEDLYVPESHPLLRLGLGRSCLTLLLSLRGCSFHMSAQQVIEFCNDCVISDGEEPCSIPEAFYGEDGDDVGTDATNGLQP